MMKDRKNINKWLRYFDEYNPVINKFVESVFDKIVFGFKIKETENEEVNKIFNNESNKERIYSLLDDITAEFVLLGEAIVIETEENEVELLRPEDVDIDIDEEKRKYVVTVINENIEMDSDKVHFIWMTDSPFDMRGSSILYSELQNLLDMKDLREQCYENPGNKEIKKSINSLDNTINKSLGKKLKMCTSGEYVGGMRRQISRVIGERLLRLISKENDFKDSNGKYLIPEICWK